MGQEIEPMQQHFNLFYPSVITLPSYYSVLNLSVKLTFWIPKDKKPLKLFVFQSQRHIQFLVFHQGQFLKPYAENFPAKLHQHTSSFNPLFFFSPKPQELGSNEAFLMFLAAQLMTEKG